MNSRGLMPHNVGIQPPPYAVDWNAELGENVNDLLK